MSTKRFGSPISYSRLIEHTYCRDKGKWVIYKSFYSLKNNFFEENFEVYVLAFLYSRLCKYLWWVIVCYKYKSPGRDILTSVRSIVASGANI